MRKNYSQNYEQYYNQVIVPENGMFCSLNQFY